MKLRVFHAGDGDCLLVSDDAGQRHILVDGGRSGTFQQHAAPELTMPEIDVVCVSHIDDDHITGIVRMFRTEVDWRRHEFELSATLPTTEPTEPRPPAVEEIWHNALYALVGPDLEVRAQNALPLAANVLRAGGQTGLAESTENLVNGERAGMELARRVSAEQLDIDVNDSADGELMTIDRARTRRIGTLRVTVIGPTDDDIDVLRARWRKWLDDFPTRVDDLRRELDRDEQALAAAADGAAVTGELGEGAGNLTPPNLASIMLLVQDGATSLLLTGDGDSEQILRGLEHHGRMDPVPDRPDATITDDNRLHTNVLKVQHHGATANVTREFVDRITADHYVFCGNGAHENPELEVVEAFARARLDGVGPDEPFAFWFSSSAETAGLTDARRRHMGEVEDLVEDLTAESRGRLSAHFLRTASFLDVL